VHVDGEIRACGGDPVPFGVHQVVEIDILVPKAEAGLVDTGEQEQVVDQAPSDRSPCACA
jgi:hypothetical protein